MYYHNIWDPLLICSQMLVLQCCFYAQFGLFLVLFHYLLDTRLALSLLLDGDLVLLSRSDGWTPVMAQLCTAAVCSYSVLLVVGRAKRCLDFCSTLYLFHYLLCVAYSGIPSSWQYYLVLAVSVAVTVLLSEWLCMHEELKWIPTTGGGGSSSAMSSMGGGSPTADGAAVGVSVSSVVSAGLGATVSSALSRLSGHSPRLHANSAGGMAGAGSSGSSAAGGGGGVGSGGVANGSSAAEMDGELTADHLDADDDVDESRSLLKLKLLKP